MFSFQCALENESRRGLIKMSSILNKLTLSFRVKSLAYALQKEQTIKKKIPFHLPE